MLHKTVEKLRASSLQKRMVLFLMPMIIVVLLVTGTFSYLQTQKVLRMQKLEMIRNFSEKVETSITGVLNRAAEVTEMVLYFPSVHNNLFSNERLLPSEQVSAYRESVNYFAVLETQFDFERIRVFTKNEDLMYQREGTHFFDYDQLFTEIPVDDLLRDRTDQLKLVDTYRSTPRVPGIRARWQISLVRFLVDGADMFVRAAVAVDIDASKLLSDWNLNIGDPYELMLINREGMILSSSYEEHIGTALPDDLVGALTARDELREGDDFYTVRPLKGYQWYLCARVPAAYLYRDTESILLLTWIMIVVACVFAALFTLVASRALTGRLRTFTHTLEQGVNRRTLPDTLELHMDEYRDDCEEISVLLHAYNRLLNHIGDLSRENARMVSRESRYRMEALRLQINSHFLYNTLASIKGYIEINEPKVASTLLMKLATFFNYSLDRNGFCIPLREEIDIIRVYLEIQQMVYAEQFSFTIDVANEAMEARIPKFILQPILENALIHGVNESEQRGWVSVVGDISDGTIRIRVEDSGPGFSAEMLGGELKTREGIGMRNVRKRLKLYFGGRARMRIENRPQGGGCVTVELPLGGMSAEEVAVYDQDAAGRR